jgi:hypothetical protein
MDRGALVSPIARSTLAMTPTQTLWIVCPVYFDLPAFLILKQAIRNVLVTATIIPPLHLRFVVIDDTAGQDRNVDDLRCCEDLIVIQTPFNLGHQHALVFGLRNLAAHVNDADWVTTLDADGEDRPDDLPRLLGALSKPDAQGRIVLARRTKRQESLWFKLLYWQFRVMFRALTGTVIRSGNYAAFHGQHVRRLLFHPAFDLSYASAFLSLKLPVELVPCERGTRYAGESKMGTARLIEHGIGMLMPFIDRIAVRALIGFGFVFVSTLGAGLTLVVMRWLNGMTVPSWTTPALFLVAMVSFSAVSSFLTLFTIFAQSGALSRRGLDRPIR